MRTSISTIVLATLIGLAPHAVAPHAVAAPPEAHAAFGTGLYGGTSGNPRIAVIVSMAYVTDGNNDGQFTCAAAAAGAVTSMTVTCSIVIADVRESASSTTPGAVGGQSAPFSSGIPPTQACIVATAGGFTTPETCTTIYLP